MNINDLRTEMYLGFMTIEEYLGAKLPFFEKISATIHRHFVAKAPLLEDVGPARQEIIDSVQKSHNPTHLKLIALFFFRAASDEDINGLMTGISKMTTIQGCVMLYEHFEKFDRCLSREVLREELSVFAEQIKKGRRELEKAFFNKYPFPQGLGEFALEAMQADAYAHKHISAFFLSLEAYIDLLLDERYPDDLTVRKAKNEGAVNVIQVNGNHNTIVQHSNDVVVNAPLKKAKKSL